MTQHRLDLLENALDSLHEALLKFQQGEAGDPKGYKFAVLHMAHFIELLFKHHVLQKHPLLIYKDPFAQRLDVNKTITLWDAINFINNESTNSISAEFRTDLNWLKKLRNEIEHHKFSMDVPAVRATMGRAFRSVLEFLRDYSDLELESYIPDQVSETFQTLSDEYEQKRKDAIRRADEIEAADSQDPSGCDEVRPVRLGCPNCDNPTLVVEMSSTTGFRCLQCGNEESDDIPAWCDICGAQSTIGELDSWDNDDSGGTERRCYYCSGRYHADKDD